MKMVEREGALTEFVEAWANLVKESARLGTDLVRSIAPSVSSAVSQVASAATRMPKASPGCSCTIPPACWMPVDAGSVRTTACAGAKATLSVRVTNCGATRRDITVEANVPASQGGSVSPATLTVGPMETATSTVTVTVADGPEQQHLVWVRGCKSHFVRWTVATGEHCAGSSTVDVDDCPDNVHHWYDHFYCQHPCQGR
jgi:hypothetical protein